MVELAASDLKESAPRSARSIMRLIRKSIENGELKEGDQLPPERELSQTYSSSRSTIRKALEFLESDGFVTRNVGSGTFVTYTPDSAINSKNVAEQISPLQLIDARIGFERQMTRLAVVHASQVDIDQLQHTLQLMEACEDDKAEFTRLDSEFHLQLARASGNLLIVQLYDKINQVRSHAQWRLAREIVLSPEKIRNYNAHHRGIVNALRQRDVVAAIAALNAHMELAQADLLGTMNASFDG